MKLSRRNFIRIVGSSAIILAPTACSSKTDLPDPFTPWAIADTPIEPIQFALSHALLAPNPHNRQPWLVDIQDQTSAILYVDPKMDLPETDPFDRQITIGLGCFLEVLAIAAQEQNYEAKIDYFPGGFDQQTLDKRPIAKIKLLKNPIISSDTLYSQIFHRRTNRKPFTKQQPTTKQLAKITKRYASTNSVFASSIAQIEQLKDLTVAAANIEFKTPAAHMESVALMRIGTAEIANNPDGISINGPAMGILKAVGIVTRKTLADEKSTAFKQGLEQYTDAAASAANFVWISTNSNTRIDQIKAGRAYVRQNLIATKLGLSMQPLSQALQEYPEMKQLLLKVHEITQTSGQRLQMLSRIGYGTKEALSPRFPLAAKLVEHENKQH
ncbi:MAG: hypothetical protein JKY46_02970 [Robiginitomaculum sp.]|nr:hypothetical protein [Robiginitomaculum sp.]